MIRRALLGLLLLVAAQAQSFLPDGSFTAPGLDYNFVAESYYQPAVPGCVSAATCITTTRASTGYAANLAGVWSSFAVDVPRITNKGILVEETRTNSIRNNSMQGAAPGSAGTLPTNWSIGSGTGLTRTLFGPSVHFGVDDLDFRFNGTTGSTSTAIHVETTTAIDASNGQTWTSSWFLALPAGDLTNISAIQLGIQTETVAGVFLTNYFSSDIKGSLTTTLQRFSSTRTITDATAGKVRPFIQISYSSGVAVDFTLRTGWPQMELGASATSPIRTTNAAVTRAADVVTVTSAPAFGSAYTLFAKATPQTPATYGINQILFQTDDTTSNERARLRRVITTGVAQGVSTTGGADTIMATSAWAANISGKFALAEASGDQATSFNGATVATGAGALPTTPTTVRIGSDQGSISQFNGYIERVTLWPTTRLSNAALQRITQ